jgi:hypothetical protein
MIKAATILALLVIILPCAYAQPHEAKQAKNSANPPPPVATAAPNQTDGASLQTKQEKHVQADVRVIKTPDKDFYDKAPFWVNIALALVACVGIWIGVCTLKQIERQTVVAERSLRAWLTIGSSMDGYAPSVDDDLQYWWIIENTGKTPARVIETQCMYEVIDSDRLTRLPDVPKYPKPISVGSLLVSPGSKQDYFTFLRMQGDGHPVNKRDMEDGVADAIRMENMYLRVYGYVRYLDGLTEEPKESRFIDYYIWPLKTRPLRASGFRPLISAPPDYTKCT